MKEKALKKVFNTLSLFLPLGSFTKTQNSLGDELFSFQGDFKLQVNISQEFGSRWGESIQSDAKQNLQLEQPH